jgi:hypothetical protein
MNPIYADETNPPLDMAVEAALHSQPLAPAPPGLAAAVMARIETEAPAASPAAVDWRIVGAAALAAVLGVLGGLLVIQAQLPRLLTPENLLLARLELWYLLQRLIFTWHTLRSELQVASLPGPLFGAPAVFGLWSVLGMLALAAGSALLAGALRLARRPVRG